MEITWKNSWRLTELNWFVRSKNTVAHVGSHWVHCEMSIKHSIASCMDRTTKDEPSGMPTVKLNGSRCAANFV